MRELRAATENVGYVRRRKLVMVELGSGVRWSAGSVANARSKSMMRTTKKGPLRWKVAAGPDHSWFHSTV